MIQTGNEKIIPPIEEGVYDRYCVLRSLIDDKINQSVWNKLYSRNLWNHIRFPDEMYMKIWIPRIGF